VAGPQHGMLTAHGKTQQICSVAGDLRIVRRGAGVE